MSVSRVIELVQQKGSLHPGTLAYYLEKEGTIPKQSLLWDVDSREEREWWQKVHDLIKKAIRTGKVGWTDSGMEFVAITEKPKP